MKNHEVKSGRKGYRKPRLTEYGSVRDLTQNMATGSFSDNGGKMTMA